MQKSILCNTSNESINFLLPFPISAELKMDVLREREVKDSLERQLTEEQKLRSKFLLPSLAPSKIVLSRVKQHASKSISTTKKGSKQWKSIIVNLSCCLSACNKRSKLFSVRRIGARQFTFMDWAAFFAAICLFTMMENWFQCSHFASQTLLCVLTAMNLTVITCLGRDYATLSKLAGMFIF